MIDSKVIQKRIFSSESPIDAEWNWIQPSIIWDLNNLQSSGLINGIYVQNPSPRIVRIIDMELKHEINSWESASNFDYFAFEDSIDN